MAEGLQAGRLDVPVVADLSGFAERLRTAVETAAEGLAAKIKVEVNSKGLKRRLKEAVKEASKGVTAKIRVEIDEDRFRTTLAGIRRRIDDTDLNIPIRPDGDSDANGGGGLLTRLRGLITNAQGEADRNPVNVPVNMRMPGRGRGRGRSLRMLGIGAIVSLLQPAVALIGQYGAGLTALVSSAAPAVGVLGAIPGLIAAAGTAAIGTKIAFSGFGEALKQTNAAAQMLAADGKVTKAQQEKLKEALDKLSPSARKAVKAVSSLQGAWSKVRMSVSERFFSKVADDIKPLAKSVFPLLKDALGDSAKQMGTLAERGAKAMQTGPFRKDFKTIASTNSRVVGHLTDSLANMGSVTKDFLVASGPFAERVAQGGERMTQWWRASVKAGRETGSLAQFLDHAGDKAAQLGRTSVGLIKGLGGVGKAAMDTGNALLDGLEGSMLRFQRWANSGAGQKSMKQFFSDAAPAFHEVNMLFGDMMRGLGRTMKDGGITDLVRQIRTELMPALGTFFEALGQTVGPAVISVISNIATAIGNLSSAGSGLGVLLMAFNGLLNVFNTLMGIIPGANTVLATFLGTMLALKVVTAVGTMLRSFGTSVTAAGTSVRGLGNTMRGTLGPGVLGPQVTMWQRMSLAYSGAAASGNRFTGAMRGIGAANRVASRAIGGITSALGGPLGIALAGVTIGLGLLASRQEDAARATQAHQERVKSLTDALVASGGAIDANVRAQAAQLLQDTELADGKGKLVDVMSEAGVSLGELTNAYLGQGKSLGALQKELQATADGHEEWITTSAGVSQGWDDEGLAAIRAKDALGAVKGELQDAAKKHKALADAINNSGTTGNTAYDRLGAAVQTFGDKTKSADERVNALKRALEALNGNTESFHDAEAQLNAVMLQIDDTMKSNIAKADGWGKALVGSDHLVNTATKNGQSLNTQLTQLRDGMLAVATRAREAGEQGLMPMSDAMDKGQEAMERARAKAIQLATDMGIPTTQAKALADQMGFVPDTVTTLITAVGIPKATAELLSLRGDLESIKPGKSIQITAPTIGAREQIEALGFTVRRIPGSKKVSVTAPTGSARVNISALAEDIARAPDKKKVTVQAIIKQAAGDLKNVQEKVAGLPKGKSIDVKAPTKVAQQALKDLGYKIKTVDGSNGKTVRITAPTGTPLANVKRIQGAINGLTGKTVHVTVKYSESGKPSVVRTHADGGIVQYANGGIRAATNRIKAFAAGAERHIAQIGRPGEIRVWNEPETQGEAYIPLAPGKRRRSEAILQRVAQMFGGQVVYFAQGALRQYAAGGVRSSSASTTRPRATTAPASTPLVGGDLNLNMTSAPTSAGQALSDAMFELRRIKLGGAYASG
ncbi:hypothetical protein SAMN05216483_6741 [Streptomyces sp. 2131.1]|uniref:hypothetical protein n=1 Tax=Streptomyces sp. 2131.1 TaxID=1855346 RepID=UPI000894FC14|nr:hypothetical protein [Streptomyces sp. 2131.1]SEE84130.1 hypothetical protein SAMN05216483_6741 [Streptomyces sp. 2131.1]